MSLDMINILVAQRRKCQIQTLMYYYISHEVKTAKEGPSFWN